MKPTVTALLCLLLFAGACRQKPKEKAKETIAYQVLTVSPRRVVFYWSHPATIQGQNIVEIRPMVSGYLEKIYVNEGAAVRKGQLLFRIKKNRNTNRIS